ncbi:hypothetical protein [Hymenobacter pini]|uniref:hypothetical protein n=1 Tax=Hymenobacter pini TaxID=2880879 RepID=UPI001CF229A7|nr:hypothetical protein [Hymenobacter pini]MCA8833109.1 hypothetical protein [Hymenobacter pini]
MKTIVYCMVIAGLTWLATSETATAQQTKPGTRTKAAYHRTSNPRNRARAGAYARYDRSNRRDEENMKLAPGFRLNMPSPPTTDYMGRPLKKKPAKTSSTTMSAGGSTTPARRP